MFEFEVFKPGNYAIGEWTPEMVAQIVADYDPVNLIEAPLTLDHIQWGPAFGWVSALRLEGDTVVATVRDMHPELYAAYQSGQYRKRSVEIYTQLRQTGRPYLGAVTFLGAANPAVPGMIDPKFSDGQQKACFVYDEHVTHDNHDTNDTKTGGGDIVSKFKDALKRLFSTAVDGLDEKEFGIGTADEAPTGDTDNKSMDVASAAAFAQAEFDQQQFSTLQEENKKLKAELAEATEAKRKEEIHSFCEDLKREGKLLPAWQDAGLEEFMLSLDSEGKKKFSGALKDEQTPAEFFKNLLGAMPKLVEFGEVAPRSGDTPAASGEEHEFMQVARQYAQDKDCGMSAAMTHVVKTQPDLHAAFLEHCSETK